MPFKTSSPTRCTPRSYFSKQIDCSGIPNSEATNGTCQCNATGSFAIQAFNGTKLSACLRTNSTACPGAYPIIASQFYGSSIKACLAANSLCFGQCSFFIADNAGVSKCLQPNGATNCRGVPGTTAEVYSDAAQTHLAGCMQTGTTACPSSSPLPFYSFSKIDGTYFLDKCVAGLTNSSACPTPYTIPGRDAALTIKACINPTGVVLSILQSCLPSTLSPFSVPVVASVADLGTAPTDCLISTIAECPTMPFGGNLRSFEIFYGSTTAGQGMLAACVAPLITKNCNNQTGYKVEVYSNKLGASANTLVSCVRSAGADTPCPAMAPFPVLAANTTGGARLDRCVTAGPCTAGFPIRLVKSDHITLAGCMARTIPSTSCPTSAIITPGSAAYDFELFGPLTPGSATPALVECQPTNRTAGATCADYGASFPVPMYLRANFTFLAACAANRVRCPTGAEIDYDFPYPLVSAAGNVILACSIRRPTCGDSLIPITGASGNRTRGCISSGARVSACAALASPGAFPYNGTVTTYAFRVAGTAALPVLAGCTLQGTAPCRGTPGGIIYADGTGVGCSTFPPEVNNTCVDFASKLSPTPYDGDMICINS